VPAPSFGVVLDSFRQPVRDALQSAARLQFREIEMPAVREVEPAQLSRSGRRDLSHYVSGLGLQLSALAADLGGNRFGEGAGLEQRLEGVRQTIHLAAELHVPIVTTHLGRVVEGAAAGELAEVIKELADIADRTGTIVAVESGGGDPAALASLVRGIDCAMLGVCYDPASQLMEGADPLAGVEQLADTIRIAHLRDAIAGSAARPGHETPLGRGQVDFAEYLAALDQAGYKRTPFLRRSGAEHPIEELAEAKAKLDRLLKGGAR
jgi:L-ribulose-5-phosphate 3-epimerase